MPDEILFRSATEAAELLERGEVSSRELTEAVLAAIDAGNARINAVVELRRDAAPAEAAAADRALASGDTRPLTGVPITIKEAFDVAGMHTTWGNPAFAGHVAAADAAVVRRLKEAGAVLIGKTNAHAMLADFGRTANEVYGTTSNPHDPTRTPGGSSGGSAAAVAAGLSFLDFGSDLVGSIRIPASFCGVFGLRPTAGTVSLDGFAPPGAPAAPNEPTSLSTVGPIARAAEDLRIALALTAGALAPPRHTRLDDFRVGVVLDDARCPVSGEVGAALANVVEAVARGGATIVEGWPDGVDPAGDYECFGFHVRQFFASLEGATLPGAAEQAQRREAVRAAWARHFEKVDVFLCPANFTAAFPHDTGDTVDGRPYADQPFWTAHAALAGLPAAAAPVRRTGAGLPVGAQIVGPAYEDATALAFAGLVGEYVSPVS
jgi:amidase